MTPTRQLGMYHKTYIIMWLLMAAAFIIFGKGIYDRYRLMNPLYGQCTS